MAGLINRDKCYIYWLHLSLTAFLKIYLQWHKKNSQCHLAIKVVKLNIKLKTFSSPQTKVLTCPSKPALLNRLAGEEVTNAENVLQSMVIIFQGDNESNYCAASNLGDTKYDAGSLHIYNRHRYKLSCAVILSGVLVTPGPRSNFHYRAGNVEKRPNGKEEFCDARMCESADRPRSWVSVSSRWLLRGRGEECSRQKPVIITGREISDVPVKNIDE